MLVANDPVVRVTATTRRPRRPARPTWAELVAIEPRLAALLAEIRTLPHADPRFCGVRAWFGPRYRGDGLKARMVRLVGWHAERDDPVLRSSEAYQAAYPVLYRALPACRDCPCGAVARALYGGGGAPWARG